MAENCRPVLSPDIVPLPIEGRRIVNDKKHFEQLAIADEGGIERDTYRFCVTSPAATDGFIRRMINLTTDIAGFDRYHTFHLVIDRFKTPKATAG
jgi:hypothetical protein